MRHRRSLAIALAVAALGVTSALPTVAATKTRWVDDDGKAGPTSCNSRVAARKGVQAAVNVSRAGDTIKVCPGTYTGAVSITGARDGLKVLAATSTRPVLQLAPAAEGTVVKVDRVDRVLLRGLTIRSNTEDACGGRTGLQLSDARKTVVRGFRIEATGTKTLTGCRLAVAVQLNGGSATITNLRVVDPSSNAVYVGSQAAVAVDGATVDYRHAAEPGTGAGGMFKADSGATGSFKHLTIDTLPTAGVSTPRLSTAVQVQGAGAGFVVDGVTIGTATFGVRVSANAVSISDVTIADAGTGVLLDSGTGADVTGVTAAGSTGIRITGATGATIHGNNLVGATGTGCEDETTGTGTAGTANTWTDNTASTPSNPVGLCDS